MLNLSYQGETLRFHNLIKKHKVEIPIIQRDYAQGRIDAKEVRTNFLTALYDSIITNNPIKLDFIYGSNINDSFQPLDGQQRLTTLFLLHWYAATIGDVIEDNKDLLCKFSYETRITSREFCNALVNNQINIDINSNDLLSSKIIDSNWFFLSWKNDPTVDSMLRSIDDIHKIFHSVDNLWDKLTSEDSSISFYYVELENIGLTDDLYIKMNARGKLLTSFENFKATFQKYIEDNKWEDDIDLREHFALKIDTSWTDYFWHNFKKNNSVDEALMRFIATNAMISLAIGNSIVEDRILKIKQLQEQPDSVKSDYFTKDGFLYLIKCFNIYNKVINENINLKLPFPFWRHKNDNSILSTLVFEDNIYSTVQINSANYTQKVLFYAQTEYLLRVENFNETNFQDWMRVIRNLVSRGSLDKDGNRPDVIRSPETFDGVINLINELANGCENIYQYFATLGNLKSQFSKDQIEEEKTKAKLINYNQELKQLIFSAEDNELLNGRIEFIFYVIGYDSNNPEYFNENDFKNVQRVFSIYFNSENSLTNDLRRALLTIEVNGEYEFYNYWWSYWNIVGANKRRLFDRFRELEYYMYCDQKEYFKKLILLMINKSLKQIAQEFIPPLGFPNWKKRLIKEISLLDEGKSNYLAIVEDNSCCYLLKSKRPRDMEGSIKIE